MFLLGCLRMKLLDVLPICIKLGRKLFSCICLFNGKNGLNDALVSKCSILCNVFEC